MPQRYRQFRIHLFLKIWLILAVLVAVVFGFLATFTDLYSPGSLLARSYADKAVFALVLAIPPGIILWWYRFKDLGVWMATIEAIEDVKERRAEMWKAAKPLVKEGIVIGIFILIFFAAIKLFNIIPQEAIDRYVDYYTVNNNLNNLNISGV